MRPLSRAVRLLIAELAIPALLICAIDLGYARYISRTPSAPLPVLFPYPILTGKYLAYRALADSDEPLDVLLMGMSQMIRANMRLVQQIVARDAHVRVRGFNAAAPLQSVEFNRRLLEDILVPIKPPRVLIHGFIPINLLYEDTPESVSALVRSLPVFSMHAGTPAAWLQNFVFGHSELIQYREVIRRQLMGQQGSDLEKWTEMARSTDQFGDMTFMVPKGPAKRLNAWDRDFALRFQAFDDVLAKTLLFQSIGHLARTCRAHGIHLVVMNNPVHPIAMQLFPRGRDDYARYVDALRAAADINGVPFFDPAPGGVGRPELFWDTVHHNAEGIQWVSAQIATYLIEHDLVPSRSDRPVRSHE